VDGIVWHELGGDRSPPDVAERVRVELDWERRYRLMRMHTALHVLCGVVFRDYGALVTGGNMGPDRARMDFEMDSADFTPERVAEIERSANEELRAGRDVYVQILPRDEAFQIPDLIRTKINLLPEGIAEVRTVEIAGLDLQADGGTHVQNTREVGELRVVGTRSKGKANKRLEIELTDPAESGNDRDGEDQLA
jgi:misacylated tRNA(Ala) deacylase